MQKTRANLNTYRTMSATVKLFKDICETVGTETHFRNPFRNKSQLSKQTCIVTTETEAAGMRSKTAREEQSRQKAAAAVEELQRQDWTSVTEEEQRRRRRGRRVKGTGVWSEGGGGGSVFSDLRAQLMCKKLRFRFSRFF